jgi:NAD(P)-dependent dehydrogenase (short-subunit alcohol dehydrogenase family)
MLPVLDAPSLEQIPCPIQPQTVPELPAPAPDQRVVLVTGSTNGLGREVARSLASSGDHVIVQGRSEERGRALVDELEDSAGSARFYQADFGSLDDVRRFATAVLRDYAHLDVLVNNAGILLINDPDRRLSDDGYELTFHVNYLAGFLLTELLLPLIEKSPAARIVNVSSLSAAPLDFDNLQLEDGYDPIRAYGQSKLAQVMHTIDLAEQYEGITSNSLHPATFMDTNMLLSAGLEPQTSVTEGRDAVLQLVDEPDVGSGGFFNGLEPARALDEQAYDADVRARLRRATQEMIAV